jgi:uncharacterized protein with ACT and thioredoxin-like domain
MRRGRGITVIAEGGPASVAEKAREFVAEAARHGLSRTEVIELLEVYL